MLLLLPSRLHDHRCSWADQNDSLLPNPSHVPNVNHCRSQHRSWAVLMVLLLLLPLVRVSVLAQLILVVLLLLLLLPLAQGERLQPGHVQQPQPQLWHER